MNAAEWGVWPIKRALASVACSEDRFCAGIKKNAFTMFSAHQMGTARMGVNPKKSCVDPEGQCWEVRLCSQAILLL